MTPYRSPLNTERNLSRPPWLGCGVSSDWHGTAIATFGESTRLATGRPKGKAAMTRDLKRGWRAFKSKPDDNGIPDQGDLTRIHRGMFSGLADPTLFNTRDWDGVLKRLDLNYAVSIALRLTVLPTWSTLRKYTSADHQVVIYGKRTRNGVTKLYIIDPMRAHSKAYSGVWVPASHVRKAAKAIENGLIITSLYPAGGWTREAIVRRRKNAQIAAMDAKASQLAKVILDAERKTRKLIDAKSEADRLAVRLARQLRDCEDDCTPTDEAIAAAREALLDQLHVFVTEQRDV